ncbi:MAG: HD domain-containing phosphohydrolase, partial [Bdellovibrionota bacterium]
VKGHEVHVSVMVDEFSFAGYCAHFSAIFHVKNPRDDIRFMREPEFIRELEVGEFLLMPLVFNGDLLGVVKTVRMSGTRFIESDIEFARLLVDQLAICVQNSKLLQKVHEQFVQVFAALGDAISKKDPYTGGHTKRVSMFSEMIAKELNLSPQEMLNIRMAAALHDIGKIGVPDYILQKNAPLNDEEFHIMKEHPRIGFEILQHIEGVEDVASGMRFHHERPDGKGYPYGMKEGEIPLCAQIIAVADTFDAMISTRPYRKGLPPMVAYEEIVKNAGTQFSSVAVEAFKSGFKKTSMYQADNISKVMTNIRKAG